MRTERNLKILAIVAITLAVGGLSIGFAAYSRTLEITSANVDVGSATFAIAFDSIVPATTGDAIGNTPAIAPGATQITGIQVGFTKPGDSITYTIGISNTGNLDAEVVSFTDYTLSTVQDDITCAVGGDEANVNAVNVCNNIDVFFTMADNTPIEVGDVLAGGDSIDVKLVIQYDVNTPEAQLPTETVNVTNINAAVNYETN